MFENVDGRTDGRMTDVGVTGILIAHLRAFGSGELKKQQKNEKLPSVKRDEKLSTKRVTVKPVLKGHSKRRPKLVFKAD